MSHIAAPFEPLRSSSDLAALRARVAEDLGVVVDGGVVLDFDAAPIAPIATITMLSKWRMPREYGLRLEYRGMFVLALAEEFFAFGLRCFELGETTGVREATVSALLLSDPVRRAEMLAAAPVRIPAGVSYAEFARSMPLAVSQSDAREWDEKFPHHALSRARRHLRRLRDTAKVVQA